MKTYATVEDYKKAYTLDEATDLTTLNNPEATQSDDSRIQYWLETASAFIRTELAIQPDFPIEIEVFREWTIDIARYKMDSYNAREDVRKRYEDVLISLRRFKDSGGLQQLFGVNEEAEEEIPIMTGFVV